MRMVIIGLLERLAIKLAKKALTPTPSNAEAGIKNTPATPTPTPK